MLLAPSLQMPPHTCALSGVRQAVQPEAASGLCSPLTRGLDAPSGSMPHTRGLLQEDEGMKVSVAGGQLALQALDLTIPAGQDVRGLTFVLRSEDSSRWWRDGAPPPCAALWQITSWCLLHMPDADSVNSTPCKAQTALMLDCTSCLGCCRWRQLQRPHPWRQGC